MEDHEGRNMMHLAHGNLLTAKVEALVNTVNTMRAMGKGIALQFKKAFPEIYAAYAKACKAGEVQVGRIGSSSTNCPPAKSPPSAPSRPWYKPGPSARPISSQKTTSAWPWSTSRSTAWPAPPLPNLARWKFGGACGLGRMGSRDFPPPSPGGLSCALAAHFPYNVRVPPEMLPLLG